MNRKQIDVTQQMVEALQRSLQIHRAGLQHVVWPHGKFFGDATPYDVAHNIFTQRNPVVRELGFNFKRGPMQPQYRQLLTKLTDARRQLEPVPQKPWVLPARPGAQGELFSSPSPNT